MRPKTLDHVALWVEDRDSIAAYCERRFGMHVIEQTDRFTLVGVDARRGKLTLFEAEGPREPGVLKHIALRASRLDGGERFEEVAPGLVLGAVEHPTDLDFDLDHVALLTPRPEPTAEAWTRLGFRQVSPGPHGVPRVEVAGAYVEFHPGEAPEVERPLLNHVAVLVDSAAEHRDEAERLGIEVDDWVDAPNTLAVFVFGPDRVRVEYVEHKPTFSLV
ncbi:MAG TPA: VOC family protein [Gaiellaceae bacterium]|nr:VOC family protein [Gaiellaceae bacterium]